MQAAFTAQEREHRAQEAKRLRAEPLLKEYMQSARDVALEELATLDATNTKEILKQQAIAQVALEFSNYLDAVIAEGGGMDGGSGAPE
jgi:hypothetical protein